MDGTSGEDRRWKYVDNTRAFSFCLGNAKLFYNPKNKLRVGRGREGKLREDP